MALFHIGHWTGSSVRYKRPRTLSEELAWSIAKIYHIHSVSEALSSYPEVANGGCQLYLVPISLTCGFQVDPITNRFDPLNEYLPNTIRNLVSSWLCRSRSSYGKRIKSRSCAWNATKWQSNSCGLKRCKLHPFGNNRRP